MVLQPARRTAEEYCYPRGGLLPRLLTLTLAGGYFLLRYYTLTHIKPLTCAVLYVARTFLPHPWVAAMERVSATKVQKKGKQTSCQLVISSDFRFFCHSIFAEAKTINNGFYGRLGYIGCIGSMRLSITHDLCHRIRLTHLPTVYNQYWQLAEVEITCCELLSVLRVLK